MSILACLGNDAEPIRDMYLTRLQAVSEVFCLIPYGHNCSTLSQKDVHVYIYTTTQVNSWLTFVHTYTKI